jgi:hypothetical protein
MYLNFGHIHIYIRQNKKNDYIHVYIIYRCHFGTSLYKRDV